MECFADSRNSSNIVDSEGSSRCEDGIEIFIIDKDVRVCMRRVHVDELGSQFVRQKSHSSYTRNGRDFRRR